MGKNNVINSLGRCIGNVVLHKILLRHTYKPESAKHLSDEIRDYSSDAFEKAQAFRWSELEKQEIKDKAIRRVKNLMERYPDQEYKEGEVKELIIETMDEMLI